MKGSLHDYFRVIIPHLVPNLVNPQALAQIRSLAQRLPVSCSALLECRLHDNNPDVDFHASFTHVTPELTTPFSLNSAWQACQTFCQEWMDSDSALHQSIQNLILEFDLPTQFINEQPIGAISPSAFIMFKPQLTIELLALIEESLALFQKPPTLDLIAKLKHCLSSLPEGAIPANIGIWLGRSHQAVRLTIKEIQLEQLFIYLDHIGWQDSTHALAAYTSTLSPLVDTLALAIDIDQTIHPRIGLECFATNQFHNQTRWQYLIDHLVQTNLCSPAKRDALLAWPGFTQRSDCPDLWPANLAYGDLLIGPNAVSVFWRKINHIKLVYEPGQPLYSKAYLAFGHSWIHSENVVFEETKPMPNAIR